MNHTSHECGIVIPCQTSGPHFIALVIVGKEVELVVKVDVSLSYYTMEMSPESNN